jgi:hypothetical protein
LWCRKWYFLGSIDPDGPETMPEIHLDFLSRQMERVLTEVGSLRDDMSVLTALTLRLDATMTGVQQELRATHTQIQRMNDWVRKLEDVAAR